MNTYKVRKGDTLNAIAKRFNTTINNIGGYRSGNPDLIFPGENLNIGDNTIKGDEFTNTKTTNFTPEIPDAPPVVPEYDFSSTLKEIETNKDERSDVRDKIAKIRNEEQDVYKTQKERFGNLEGDRMKLGDIQSQLNALKLQRQAIPTSVSDRYRGRGVTAGALQNMTSQELSRNAIASTDLAATGQLLQGNINTAIDLIEEATELELAPIQKRLDYEESNLDRLIDSYNDDRSEYNKQIVAQAKKEKEKLQRERNSLTDLRNLRRDNRIMAQEARKGGASSWVVKSIMGANSYEEALDKASKYLGKVEDYKGAREQRAIEAAKRAAEYHKKRMEDKDTSGGEEDWMDAAITKAAEE